MANDEFVAVVDVYAVPKPKHRKYYRQEWSSKPLFKCIVSVNPKEGGTEVLNIRLRSSEDNSLIANAPYDGLHGVHSVVDSARSFVIIVKNNHMHAWLGVEFRVPEDSTKFSLAIQKFMRRRMFEPTGFKGWPVLTDKRHTSDPV